MSGVNPKWRKSSFCGSNACPEVTWLPPHDCGGGSCPQVAHDGDRVGIRESTDPDTIVWFTADGWDAFKAGVKAGEFDRPAATE